MKRLIKGISLALILMCLTIVAGCGDDEGLPYWIEADNPDINFSDPNETGVCLVTVTVFDSKGNPAEDGNMVFTLSDGAAGTFFDEGVAVDTVDVDLEDGVAEVFFHANPAVAETVYVYAYCPGYPNDKVLSVRIDVTP